MIRVEKLSFYYASELFILKELDFQIEKGEFISVLGESGSGKSTLLKLMYGWEDATSGGITFDEKKVTGPKFNLIPGHPEMKFVPQEFDLLDYVTVAENVGKYLSNFDLEWKNLAIDKALEVVGLKEFRNQFPNKLSGGQRQRVSIARALAANPKLLLLDEPYSHLDQPLKFEIRKNIWNWAKEMKCTVILTTHDAQDALGYSDRMMVLKSGEILQFDTPETVRNHPHNEYVASLLGEYSVLNSLQMKRIFDLDIPEANKALIYPEEVLWDETGVQFETTDIRYRGRDYMIEAEREGAKLRFYSDMKPNTSLINLKIQGFRLI